MKWHNLRESLIYGDNHLKQVVERYEAETDIEMYGPGVGLSLTPYYKLCIAVNPGGFLSNSVVQQILQMIAHARTR